MKLSVKKVKLNETLSEETPCFSADLYDNGVFISGVTNRGHGGSNDFSDRVDAKYETLDVECEVMGLVETYNFITKNQSKGFVLSKGGQEYIQKFPRPIGKLKKATNYVDWLARQKASFVKDGYELLNRNI